MAPSGTENPPKGKEDDVVAAVVLPCTDLDATLDFFLARLGFRLDAIFPADKPRIADLSGHGLSLRLEVGDDSAPGVLRLACPFPSSLANRPTQIRAPNGTRIDFVEARQPLLLPPVRAAFVVSRVGDSAGWHTGRAGMRYRDLIEGRHGGRFVASHIQIPQGGRVPDYVHFHRIQFQMIYCYKGWVRLVYEDQGEPFVMQAGDCVLQPPEIRHRVLESSAALEVIEISSPAEHETRTDHDMTLPSAATVGTRRFDGQRFLHHVAAEAPWQSGRLPGMRTRDIGLDVATGGIATAQVLQRSGGVQPVVMTHHAEFLFTFVLAGSLKLLSQGRVEALSAGDSFVMPAGRAYTFSDASVELQVLQVALPAGFESSIDPAND